MAKQRLDVVLVEKGLASSREKAKALIMAGKVLVDEKKIDKAGTEINPELPIRLLGQDIPYVSRGGLKLEKALQVFPVDMTGKVVADIGASTGGFVDCALQNGAVKVFAIDVGYNQLDWKLRSDARVVNMEKTNARYLEADSLGEMVDIITTDVSFISLEKILPPAMAFLKEGGHVLALIKPQFEAGREKIGKKGVVRDPAVHEEVIEDFVRNATDAGFRVCGVTFSPITGPEGNIEFLGHLSCDASDAGKVDAKKIVEDAHNSLKG